MKSILTIFCACLTIQVIRGAVVTCPGAKKSSCKCQLTNGVSCPAGSYCPSYSSDEIVQFADTIAMENCTVRGDGVLQCPCTPGFFCPENTLSPSYCCAGHFCKTPAVIEECKAGTFCKTGFVEGIGCGSGSCPKGSEYASRTGAFIAIVINFAILRIIFWVKEFIVAKVKESEDGNLSMMKEEKVAAQRTAKSYQALSIGKGDYGESPDLEEGSNCSESHSHAVVPIDEAHEPNTTGDADVDQSYEIKFKNITFTLPSGVTIMKGVTGEFKSRRMCAIMGPSGSGKTTIMNLITGKAPKTAGEIHVNGELVNDLSKWKKLVGFVPQEDVMIRQLTVRDNISFSAEYRLPLEMTQREREEVVNDTLLSLGIDHVQHSVIGDERERGISGGQRKRVNIGIELVALPKVLFLDEPTSGLDSTSSLVLARQLKEIAQRRNVTIASVIHQPSIQAFLEFDDLLLLGKGGQTVYHGPINEAEAYFASIGFTTAPGLTNPADFFLDIANGAVDREGDPDFSPPDLFRFWSNKMKGLDINASAEDENGGVENGVDVSTPRHIERLDQELNPLQSTSAMMTATRSICSFFYHRWMNIVLDLRNAVTSIAQEITHKDPIRNTPGFFIQFKACLFRAHKQKFRRFGAYVSQMFIHMGVALVVSSVATDLQYVGPLPGVICAVVERDLKPFCASPLLDSYQGVANFLCFGTIFAAISISTGTFGNEQVNYWRECTSGLKTIPYFLAKWTVELPNIVAAALFFWLAFTIRFPNTNSPGVMYLLFFATYFWAWALGFLLSSLAPPRSVFLLGVLAALLLAVAFSGSNPTLNEVRDLPDGINWLWSLSGTRWVLEGFYVSQVKYYEDVPSGPLKGDPYMDIDAGLDKIGYNIDNFTKSVNWLFIDGFIYGGAALVIMMFTNRDKKK